MLKKLTGETCYIGKRLIEKYLLIFLLTPV